MVTKKFQFFDVVVYAILAVVLILCAYPLYFTVLASFSYAENVFRGEVWLWPVGFNLKAYKSVLDQASVWRGYGNSIIYTVLATLVNLAVNIPCAYVLSKKHLIGRNFFMMIFAFTMYFGGGLIPNYLLMKSLGMLDNRLAMIVCFPLSVYNMIVARTYFSSSIPEELYESARIDGASEYRTFLQVALPLSKPILAVLTLWFAMGHWNGYFSAMIYLNSPEKYPLQLVLRDILILNEQMLYSDTMSGEDMLAMRERQNIIEMMKYALIFFSSAPMLILYPFIQKYFVKGVMIGAIKG